MFGNDSGRWAACSACSLLIDAGQWDMLTRRVFKQIRNRSGITPETVRSLRGELRQLYELVRVNLIVRASLTVIQPHYIKKICVNLC